MVESGIQYALACLALMCNNEQVVKKNLRVVRWYFKAREQGHAYAQYNLGDMNEYGEGVDTNDSTAVELYCKAAEQGHVAARRNLDRLNIN